MEEKGVMEKRGRSDGMMKQLVNSAEFQGGENMENAPVCYIVANCNIETNRKTTDGKNGGKISIYENIA